MVSDAADCHLIVERMLREYPAHKGSVTYSFFRESAPTRTSVSPQLVLCRLQQDRFTPSIPAYSATIPFFRPSTGRAEGWASMLRFWCFSVCIGRIRLEMAPRCGALYGVNGTAVPEGITFRPFSTNLHGYKFGRAGGWALQRVVTRLKNHGSMPSPPVQPR